MRVETRHLIAHYSSKQAAGPYTCSALLFGRKYMLKNLIGTRRLRECVACFRQFYSLHSCGMLPSIHFHHAPALAVFKVEVHLVTQLVHREIFQCICRLLLLPHITLPDHTVPNRDRSRLVIYVSSRRVTLLLLSISLKPVVAYAMILSHVWPIVGQSLICI